MSNVLMSGPDSKRDTELGEDAAADCYTRHEILRRVQGGEGCCFANTDCQPQEFSSGPLVMAFIRHSCSHTD